MFPFQENSKLSNRASKVVEPQTVHQPNNMPESMNLDPGANDTTSTNQKPIAGKIVQTGLERYITITEKRKRSPQANNPEPAPKLAKGNKESKNYYDILRVAEETPEDHETNPKETKFKPPPIYIRQSSNTELVNGIKKLIGVNNFYIVDLLRGNIKETKVQALKEVHYTQIVNWLDSQNKNYYTYQLKSAKGLRVVIKGIDANVNADEIIEDLKAQGFEAKSVYNILNKYKIPQPMFKVELTPEASKAPKGKVHPIYNIKYILHRRVTVEEPYKRANIVQCTNCQEYGHTKSYCKLANVCVVCGELHPTISCNKDKSNPEHKRCSNCNGNHTANYRGCPVFTTINKKGNYVKQPQVIKAHSDRKTTTTNGQVGPTYQVTSSHINQPFPYTRNLSYADAAKSCPPPNNNATQGDILQILLTLTTNIQQLTNTMQQMQAMLNKQTEILAKLTQP